MKVVLQVSLNDALTPILKTVSDAVRAAGVCAADLPPFPDRPVEAVSQSIAKDGIVTVTLLPTPDLADWVGRVLAMRRP